MTYDSYDEIEVDNLETQDAQEIATLAADVSPTTKKFHLNELLTLTTGMMLAQEGTAAVHRLVAFVMEVDADVVQTMAHIETVKNCIEEQLPFLQDVKLSGLYPIYQYDSSPTNPYLTVWLEMQSLHFGDEHEVMTFRAWQACRNGLFGDTAANGNGIATNGDMPAGAMGDSVTRRQSR